jgi:hypothetical protein
LNLAFMISNLEFSDVLNLEFIVLNLDIIVRNLAFLVCLCQKIMLKPQNETLQP